MKHIKPSTEFKKWYKKTYGLEATEIVMADERLDKLYEKLITYSEKKKDANFNS